ncbi:hypothetical protein DSO57_1015250 [Entomophthora muscae]|uniref:Uncharacterized protein n=1 Tax=Entomophthora muscae TaxID=34485 RepID=A0ACC2SI16_9FUNG|nr:hypothetical protein DSO57_1015250 [Entomophthora muscae]
MGFQKISMLEYLEPELFHATMDSLLKECRAELMVRCTERGLSSEGTKQDLAHRLLDWREHYKPGKLASTPQLSLNRETSIDLKKEGFDYIDKELLCEEYGLKEYCNISLDELTFLDHLGTGGFKDCYRGVFRGQEVAICEFRAEKARKMDIPFFKNELEILKQVKHPNIITVHGVAGLGSRLMVVTELCGTGDLLSYMGKTPKPSFLEQVAVFQSFL